jgi:hypothetical protein
MMKQAELSEIEQILLADPHVTAVKHSKYSTIPDMDYSLWSKRKHAESMMSVIAEYLQMPCVLDTFGLDHGARRRWENTLPKKIQAFLDKNPLGANSLCRIGFSIGDLIKNYRGPHTGALRRLQKQVWTGFPKKYSSVPVAEKLEIMERTKARVYTLLEYLSHQNSETFI